MPSIRDYCYWYGVFGPEELPFDENDAIVFAFLSYLDLEAFPYQFDNQELGEIYLKITEEEDVRLLKTVDSLLLKEEYRRVFDAIAQSKRFSHLTLKVFKDILSVEEDLQFAAMIFEWSEQEFIISFRGTDDSIVGWKEDFMMSFCEVSAQKMALQFLKENIRENNRYILTGHSKGGNLALYAASRLEKPQQDAIVQLYTLDGPGLCSDVFDLTVLEPLYDRIYAIQPVTSIVGRLFELPYHHKKIVQAQGKGIAQHALINWKLGPDGVKSVLKQDATSNWIQENVSAWLASISLSERKSYVEDVFKRIAMHDEQTVFDITDRGISGAEELLINLLGSHSETKRYTFRFIWKSLIGDLFSLRWQTFLERQYTQPFLLFMAGLLLILFTDSFLRYSLLGAWLALVLVQGINLFHRLQNNHFDIEAESIRTSIFLVFSTLFLVFLLKENAAEFLSNMIMGVTCLIFAVYHSQKVTKKREHYFFRIMTGFECIILLTIGLFCLFAGYHAIPAGMVGLGILLEADALYHVLKVYFQTIYEKDE